MQNKNFKYLYLNFEKIYIKNLLAIHFYYNFLLFQTN
jgi:hypothetical protein